MNLHLVGGFLGSGKTTAIIGAVKYLLAQGRRVGVVTNDQGKYLVDTAFFKLSDVPAVQVSGTCFCCNYGDLEARIDLLRDQIQPDAIFAESIGSCTDLIATVIKPLQRLRDGADAPTSYSGIVDSRLLRLWMLGLPLPFSDNLVYIFEKQIEETGLLVLNKVDLLTPERLQELGRMVGEHYADKDILYQNSLDSQDIRRWVEKIESTSFAIPSRSLDIDYSRYGIAESQLAWLNEAIDLDVADGQGREAVLKLLTTVIALVQTRRAAIGHIKVFIQDGGEDSKVSITPLQESGWEQKVPPLKGNRVQLLLNARVEMDASELRRVVQQALEETTRASGAVYHESDVTFFNPSPHTSEHRME